MAFVPAPERDRGHGRDALQPGTPEDHLNLTVPLLAVAYGLSLASLPLYTFMDRGSYVDNMVRAVEIFNAFLSRGVLSAAFNEPLWWWLNQALFSLFGVDIALRVIIALPAAIVAYWMLRQNTGPLVWSIVFLLAPQILKNHVIHLRQGAAVSLFLVAWYSSIGYWRWILLALLPFIHSSFFIVGLLVVVEHFLREYRAWWGTTVLVFAGVSIAVALGLGWVASVFGARQATEHTFVQTNATGLGFLFWLAMLAVYLLEGEAFVAPHRFAVGSITCYLCSYFLVDVGARIFESALPVVLLAGLELTAWRRRAFLAGIVLSILYQYAERWSQSWLGFGV